ncbi:MAG: hypothetical protein WCI04_00725 [archaeon]
MVNPKGNGGFKPLSGQAFEKLNAAAKDPKNITYSDIARAANIPRSTVIKHLKLLVLRPKGNFLKSRSMKQPSIEARLAVREKLMREFILHEVMRGNAVGINQLIARYGGTKSFAGIVLKNVEFDISFRGARIKRLSVADQPYGNSRLVSPHSVSLKKVKFKKK